MKKRSLSAVQKRAIVIVILGVAVLSFQLFDLPIKGISDYANLIIGGWIISVGYANWRQRDDATKK